MARRSRIVIAGVTGTAAALLLVRSDARRAWQNFRRYSAPGSGSYERLAGLCLAGFYRRVAREVAEHGTTGSLLEIGPGPGHLAVEVARLTDYDIMAVDIDAAMVERARNRAEGEAFGDRIRIVEGDVGSLPFEAGAFEIVISTFSLHHWADPARAFDEIHRVLPPGGRALIWDLQPAWGHLETGGPRPASVMEASPFGGLTIQSVHWPLGLPLVVRYELVRDGLHDTNAGPRASGSA
jgi:ubiquinone/menaquinone biosynthesis C-methylase UbiE